jgi:hypothetical protein
MGNLNRRRAAFRDDDSFLSRATPQRFTAEEYVAYWQILLQKSVETGREA